MSQARLFSDHSRPRRTLPVIILLILGGLAIASWQILPANETAAGPVQNNFVPLPLPQVNQPSAALQESVSQQTESRLHSDTITVKSVQSAKPQAESDILPPVIGTLGISEVAATDSLQASHCNSCYRL